MLDQVVTGGSQSKKAFCRDCLETNDGAVVENREFQTTEQSASFLKRIHSRAGLSPEVLDKKSPSNQNNNVRDDSDTDDFRCLTEQSCRNRRLHFITFLAGSNELHCVFQPNEVQPSCCDPLPVRSSCYTGRCTPSPCPSPTERFSKSPLSPATQYPCSKSSSVEDSITEWLRCKERSRCKEMSRSKDTSERLFGNRKPCKKTDLFPASSTSDVSCKKPPKWECVEKEPRPPPPPPYCEPMCFSATPKPSYCPKRISCSSSLPCSSSLFRDVLDDSYALDPCEPIIKPDLSCVPQCKSTTNIPTTCHSCLSCLDTSDTANMRTYRQFRKDYVRKWGIKISNSDGGEWVYKDCDNIFPIYSRKNGKVTRITLANDNDPCCASSCLKKCEDILQSTPCCNLSNRQRRGSICRKLGMCEDSVKESCKPKITCFIERNCPTTKNLPASTKRPRACTSGLDFPSTPRQAAACCNSGGFSKTPPCASPPSCLKDSQTPKSSCLKQMNKVVTPCQSPVMSCSCRAEKPKCQSPVMSCSCRAEKPKCQSPKPSSCNAFGSTCG